MKKRSDGPEAKRTRNPLRPRVLGSPPHRPPRGIAAAELRLAGSLRRPQPYDAWHHPEGPSMPAGRQLMLEPWVSRKFSFDVPVERFDALLSRLRGTGPRIAAAVRGLTPAALTARRAVAWSIQEHVGHLHDLEQLHLRRLDELARGERTLSAADMQNRATWDADHNSKPFAAVLDAFTSRRGELLARLVALDGAGLARHALHPRLQQPMRAIDVAWFCAEHDDHHVAKLEQLAAAAATAGAATPARPLASAWSALPLDQPMPTLDRRRLIGDQAMLSHVTLHAGCVVPMHAHANEQFACVLSGRVRFTLADAVRELGAGEVLWLPAHAPHAAEALETAVILDVFAPPSQVTGVDAKR